MLYRFVIPVVSAILECLLLVLKNSWSKKLVFPCNWSLLYDGDIFVESDWEVSLLFILALMCCCKFVDLFPYYCSCWDFYIWLVHWQWADSISSLKDRIVTFILLAISWIPNMHASDLTWFFNSILLKSRRILWDWQLF